MSETATFPAMINKKPGRLHHVRFDPPVGVILDMFRTSYLNLFRRKAYKTQLNLVVLLFYSAVLPACQKSRDRGVNVIAAPRATQKCLPPSLWSV
jgi:hypothetical protein